jgi:hypothetical protein
LLLSSNERLAAFQDEAVKSAKGSFYDDYFGYSRSI